MQKLNVMCWRGCAYVLKIGFINILKQKTAKILWVTKKKKNNSNLKENYTQKNEYDVFFCFFFLTWLSISSFSFYNFFFLFEIECYSFSEINPRDFQVAELLFIAFCYYCNIFWNKETVLFRDCSPESSWRMNQLISCDNKKSEHLNNSWNHNGFFKIKKIKKLHL